ncbi:hypothetical protein [Actinomadura mexicana]|uniref:Subtilisin inhibitor-like n=1 Tax=Actinomadura mexicana TaxID=134959 RepID=A0A238VRK6_9ACTN|nr:hypothetical protein [Actinomadura mexicana]SNR36811.1 hypothetical protein SAMN06265355_102261 [Actinomadura mexicana]
MTRAPRMSSVSRLMAAALLATAIPAAAVVSTAPPAQAVTGTIAHADPSSIPPSPDYVCDDLMTLRLPTMPFTEVYADNCEAQHGTPYGQFTDKIIAERHAPQAHIRCQRGLVMEGAKHFVTNDIDCHLVWYQKPS